MRVIDGDSNEQLGVLQLQDALNLARTRGVDLVEIAPNATPPVCKVIDFGKFRYEQAKKDKEARKHQHGGKVKEIQLSPTIDAHDFSVKLQHAIDFLAEDMKVKVTLRFRGREMAHKEYGFQQVNKFVQALAAWGHPDAAPKLIGKGINVMITPLPKNKRPKHHTDSNNGEHSAEAPKKPAEAKKVVPTNAADDSSASGFSNTPFSRIETAS